MSEDATQATSVPSTTYQRLAEPFAVPEHAKVNKGGMDQTYAPWTEYVERMNAVLGVENWSSRIVREGFTDTECWVLAEVEAVIDGQKVIRQQYGCEPITKGRNATPTTDLLKTTASDAIKKAISLLGPGLYLSVKDERVAIEAAMKEAVQAAAAAQRAERANPTPQQATPAATPAANPGTQASRSASMPSAASAAPSSSSTTATPAETPLKQWERLVVEAEAISLPTLGAVKAVDTRALSAAQLASYTKRLADSIAGFRREQQGAA